MEQTRLKAINDVVVATKNNRGIISVTTQSGIKSTFSNPVNHDYEPSSFFKFVKMGDQISKKANNDTILIKREKDTYFFINNKTL